MKRFLPWTMAIRRRRQLLLCVAVGLALLAAAFTVFPSRHPAHDAASVLQQRRLANPGWVAECTELSWRGKPVYQLINTGEETLQHVTVRSWSKELLPVLRVGATDAPVALLETPLSSPPYAIPPRQSLWFVGPTPPPAQFIVEWQAGGQLHHAYLSVASSNISGQGPVWHEKPNAVH
jgi:hypothetical protein